MATSVKNLNKHLQLAVRQLKLISGIVAEIPDSTSEIVEEIYGLLLSLTERDPQRNEVTRDRCGPKGNSQHDDAECPKSRG